MNVVQIIHRHQKTKRANTLDSRQQQFIFVDGFVHREHRFRFGEHRRLSLGILGGELQANPRRRRAKGVAQHLRRKLVTTAEAEAAYLRLV